MLEPMIRSSQIFDSIAVFIDADACPVKQEIYRVAERHARKGTAVKVLVVTNSPIAMPRDIFLAGGRTLPLPLVGRGRGGGREVIRKDRRFLACVFARASPPDPPPHPPPTRGEGAG
jgi:hypothetical protein